ncbi:MAG: methylated-DNA--[Clostridia bacterium]|nr:methylated-DNA--[protein]-cysteine S-methyltransferase [Clostridia bacterium]MBQ4157454.1 methylated-DNA--[protein]-cysteine S-methyltransferase [Clostridia bacterium]
MIPGNSCPLLEKASEALTDYFLLKRTDFSDIPLLISGTPFQKSVLSALLKIPFGETRTYLDIAKQIGKPRASRAVGQACARNQILIFIPCHRVVGSNRSLTGFQGGMDMKRNLLNLEKDYCLAKISAI